MLVFTKTRSVAEFGRYSVEEHLDRNENPSGTYTIWDKEKRRDILRDDCILKFKDKEQTIDFVQTYLIGKEKEERE